MYLNTLAIHVHKSISYHTRYVHKWEYFTTPNSISSGVVSFLPQLLSKKQQVVIFHLHLFSKIGRTDAGPSTISLTLVSADI